MQHARLRLAVVGALVALALAGCGGGSKTSHAKDTSPQTEVAQTKLARTDVIQPEIAQPEVAQTNGLERRSAAQVEQEAAAALRAANSVHVTARGRFEGKPARLDLRIQGDSSTGTLGLKGAQLKVTVIGDDAYLKADQRSWKTLGAPPAAQRRLHDRWVKVAAKQLDLEGFAIDSLAASMTQHDSPLEPTVQQATLAGNKVVVLSLQDGSKLYVANTGPAYPLRADCKGADAARLDFTEYGADFHITAPSTFMDLSSTFV
jgi:hypothetical protein